MTIFKDLAPLVRVGTLNPKTEPSRKQITDCRSIWVSGFEFGLDNFIFQDSSSVFGSYGLYPE
jgi:hypothetical protein